MSRLKRLVKRKCSLLKSRFDSMPFRRRRSLEETQTFEYLGPRFADMYCSTLNECKIYTRSVALNDFCNSFSRYDDKYLLCS